MEKISNPHDKFFKETFSRLEIARDFVLHYVPPEITALLDPKTLEISKDSYVDEKLKERFSDILYKVDLKTKGRVFVYLLFEHKSYPDSEAELQLLMYMVRIWMQYLKQEKKWPLPAILPMVVYHRKTQWKVKRTFHDLVDLPDPLGTFVPNFEYLLWDLSGYNDEEIKGGSFLKVACLLMKHIFSEDMGRRLPAFLGLLEGVVDNRSALQYLEAVLRYISSGSSHVRKEEIIKALKEVFVDEGDDIMSTLAEQWIEEGVQKGMQKGVQQGTMNLLSRLIARHFRVSPDSVHPILAGLTTEQLEELGERFIDAESLDEIRRWADQKRLAMAQ